MNLVDTASVPDNQLNRVDKIKRPWRLACPLPCAAAGLLKWVIEKLTSRPDPEIARVTLMPVEPCRLSSELRLGLPVSSSNHTVPCKPLSLQFIAADQTRDQSRPGPYGEGTCLAQVY
ncbi:hypothetical protein RRG08_012885 [Elysia crispata]|uniref:Uncharacterized protein n=1 Tax=Elysia crispata TaxID=231223 RepID=A0AAE1ASI0_9GAST|nr:hypothetical protein RRG08_012885 [Elysia crispata]